MLGDQLGHLEHIHHFFATENRFQVLISIDVALVLLVLEIMLLDVYPQSLHDFRTGHRSASYYLGQLLTYLHRLHERRIRLRHNIIL